jgi:Fic family protein
MGAYCDSDSSTKVLFVKDFSRRDILQYMPYQFTFTAEIVRLLQIIEQSRAEVNLTVLPPAMAESLRLRARVRSTHFSTRIEGNRLTLVEAEQAVLDGRQFPGRERDTLEVQHYFQALEQVESWVEQGVPINEENIRKLHAVIYGDKRARPTPIRDGQNAVRDGQGGLVYLPPEAKDVPSLMSELVAWIRQAEGDQPVPVVAGLAHYQFVTIHPYFDGNGRTARALATWILYRGGYDLGRFYALEEFYVQDLAGYYDALVTHPHHNYYEGRATADITPWLVYFLKGMASVFSSVASEVRSRAVEADPQAEVLLRRLDRRGRMVLGLFERQEDITANDVARILGLSPRQVRDLLAGWVEAGWLVIGDPARKSRRYQLSAEYRRFIGDRIVTMRKTKMTVRVPQELLENVKRYATEHNTTLTSLIEAYLRRIPAGQSMENAPIVRRLSGSLTPDVTVQDYKKHLEDKYARHAESGK